MLCYFVKVLGFYFGVARGETQRAGKVGLELDAFDRATKLDDLIVRRLAQAKYGHFAVVTARRHKLFFGVDRNVVYGCHVLFLEKKRFLNFKF